MELGDLAIIIIIVAIIIGGVYFFYYDSSKFDCLELIAKEYCEEHNMTFGNIYYTIAPPLFKCRVDDRKQPTEQFLFIEEELEQC